MHVYLIVHGYEHDLQAWAHTLGESSKRMQRVLSGHTFVAINQGVCIEIHVTLGTFLISGENAFDFGLQLLRP